MTTQSRNKREGHYAGKHQGKHNRAQFPIRPKWIKKNVPFPIEAGPSSHAASTANREKQDRLFLAAQ